MKIALYIEDGLEQIVLTPETETEKGIVAKLHDDDRQLSVCRGTFYATRGGWMTQRDLAHVHWGIHEGKRKDDDSTIIVLRPKQEEKA